MSSFAGAPRQAPTEAVRHMVEGLSELEAAMAQSAARGPWPAGHEAVSRCIDRLAALQARELPDIGEEFCELLIAHANLTLASLAAGRPNYVRPLPSPLSPELARAEMAQAIAALRRCCRSFAARSTIHG